jgi:type IV secretion system protein VirB4
LPSPLSVFGRSTPLTRRQLGGKTINRLLSGGGTVEPSAEQIARIRRIAGILSEELKEYHPKVLGVVRRGRALFSEIAEAVAFAMTGYWRQVPLTTSGAASIFSEAFIVGTETFEVRMPHRSAWGACLGINDFPYLTSPGMFDRFLAASYRHTVFHAFRCLASVDGQALATRKQNRMRQAGDRALSQADEP